MSTSTYRTSGLSIPIPNAIVATTTQSDASIQFSIELARMSVVKSFSANVCVLCVYVRVVVDVDAVSTESN